MARTNKKTRIKGLPPKLQLQERDSVTGSFPTNIRTASDNRTGHSPSRFDDTETQAFVTTNVFYGSLVATDSLDLTTENTSSITASAPLRKGVSDQYARFTVSGAENLQPFRDNGNPAADGKSINNAFYATGSLVEDVGIGFQQPLWSKTKIEIDISNTTTTTMGYRSGSGVGGVDVPMVYYNAGTKTYMPVGSLRRWDEYQDTTGSQLQATVFARQKAIGFLPSMTLLALDTVSRYYDGTPTSVFGFPYHPKFTVRQNDPNSGSILIPASDYINEPFLVEKVVVEFSCSHQGVDWPEAQGGGRFTNSIGTFFLLNQRKGGKVSASLNISGSIEEISSSPFPNLQYNLEASNLTASMDIVTFNQFMFIPVSQSEANDFNATDRDFFNAQTLKGIMPVFTKDVTPTGSNINFTGSLTLSGAITSPTPTLNLDFSRFANISEVVPLPFDFRALQLPAGLAGFANTSDYMEVVSTGFTGGRNGVFGKPNNRNLNRNLTGIVESQIDDEQGATGRKIAPVISSKTPYLLKPGDQLIVGWQGPYPLSEWNLMKNPSPFAPGPIYIGPQLSLLPGPAKITLYGCKVSAGEESHDTLNQFLTSQVVHEVIG